MKPKVHVLTTGEIASYCGVNLRTVIRWLDSEKLKGYKLPGRGNNRILTADFIDFLNQNRMPIPSSLAKVEDPLVLIVDDEAAMAKSIKRIAHKAGVRSLIAVDGFQAGLMLSMHKPQMITLDLSMSGFNGFDVLKFARDQEGLQGIKIIVISALGQNKLDEALALGADRVLSKPFDASELITEFESLFLSNVF